ncbi:MAG: 4-(cytidine 5'-diphospho)-2-C-methyl-D-erythritol kinase [Micrococcales bacterium]
MTWKVATDSRTNWLRAETVKYFTVETARLFTILNDPDSWGNSAPRTRTTVETNRQLGYAFADETKVDIQFAEVNASISKVTLTAFNLHDRDELKEAMSYWDGVLAEVTKRTMSEPVIVYSAPGKINLFFAVGPLRKDGYHEVASVYQAVNLRETVVVEPSSNWSVEVRGDLSRVHIDSVPTGEDNLVVKAAKALAKAVKIKNPIPVHFSIDKRVPVAGGMGGGSADAAAAIAAVNQLWGNKANHETLMQVCAGVGADVPFALSGGLALGTGTGDQIEMLAQPGEYHWALVVDELGLSTPLVYGRVDELRSAPGQTPEQQPEPKVSSNLLKALKSGASAEELAPLLHNDLQAAAITLRPGLRFILSLVEEVKALTAIVSGSGPTVAFLGRNAEDAEAIASRLRTRGLRVIVAGSPANGAEPAA